jgi:hypothetical protein
MEVPGAGGAPWGATGAEVANTGPRLGDGTMSLLQDLVVCGVGVGVPESAALGDATPTPRVLEYCESGGIGTVLARFS